MKNPFAKSKAPAADFNASKLPHNRREVFFDVLKLHWHDFLWLGLLLLCFAAPMMLFAWIENSYSYEIMQSINSLPDSEREALYNEIISMSNTRALLNVFAFLLISVCVAGVIRIIRQYAWEENVSLLGDFVEGVKQNAAQMALAGLIVGVMNAISVCSYNLNSLEKDGFVSLLLAIPIGFFILCVIPVLAYTAVCIPIYNNSFIGNVKIGILIYAKSPLKTLLALICCFLFFIPIAISNIYCSIFGRIFGAIFAPAIMLGWFLFASNQLDKYVNKEHFPSLVGRGIFPMKEEKRDDMQTNDYITSDKQLDFEVSDFDFEVDDNQN